MPSDDARDRSASPVREPKSKKQKTGGFKWKEKRPRDEEDAANASRNAVGGSGSGALERGYRNRSPRRDSYRSGEREQQQQQQPKPRQQDQDEQRPRPQSPSRGDKPGEKSSREAKGKPSEDPDKPKPRTKDGEKSQKKEKKAKKPAKPVSNEPMIVVNVNDRLGTKAAIPCLASDSVKAFKAIVAAHIGRQPYEIMLKRQGERPFKDQLTLEDYGVSNGVQLDLELDTGD